MIYLDNAATTWPKPQSVLETMQKVLNSGGNPGRGGHSVAVEANRLIYSVRESLADFFGADDPTCVIFTCNATHALNQALFGLLKPGDHVITTSLEHNAVTRPLKALSVRGIEITEIAVIPEKEFPWQELEKAFRKNTKLVVTLHASNVTGTLLPVERIGRIARANGAYYLVDAAQSAGLFKIDLARMPIDILTFPGHKGLLGPQGTGGLIVRPKISLEPLIYGGTGSLSESDLQPDFLPDALESGTLNGVGIAGLGAGIAYINNIGLDRIRVREQELCQKLINGLKCIPEIKIYGGLDASKKAPIVAFNIGSVDSTVVSFTLEQVAGIIARAGLHCAPHAHSTLGTLEQGIIRLSPSHFTTEEEIEQALEAIELVVQTLS